ncbi:MAG: hypothetical protein QXV46_06420 [Candidatus Bathyarchaeia archaeon]
MLKVVLRQPSLKIEELRVENIWRLGQAIGCIAEDRQHGIVIERSYS